ncbi:hypothetical protein [Pyramidobacter piscolens]|uniref:hypothetical protein n=1 Tax=Pyramidobacter piscolens TaxID=638849 RepID=UPI002AB099BE|nr:hypothetical protein [Pyramidobacter piscolens]
MPEQWVRGIAEDDFILGDDNRFDSKEEACAAGEAEAIKLGLDTYFVGRIKWLDFAELIDFPDDITQIVIDCMAEEANDSWGCDAEDAFANAVSLCDQSALERDLFAVIAKWCKSLRVNGCFVVTDIEEFAVQEKPE